MSEKIKLIVGLGNIGVAYSSTRHNAGFDFVDKIAQKNQGLFSPDRRFFGDLCKVSIEGNAVWLLKPSTLMNLSGKSVAAIASFFKLKPEEILVVHDELDLSPGSVKLKIGGGSAGHNGLKSISQMLGSNAFIRLRVGIGHPRDFQSQMPVADYVLSRPPLSDRILIGESYKRIAEVLPLIINGDFSRAMQTLNEKTSYPD